MHQPLPRFAQGCNLRKGCVTGFSKGHSCFETIALFFVPKLKRIFSALTPSNDHHLGGLLPFEVRIMQD
jgi:hypothetical protein